MYYLLRDNDGEAFCAIVIPEARRDGGAVYLSLDDLRMNTGPTRAYEIRQKENKTDLFYNAIGSINVDWGIDHKMPSWDAVAKSLTPLEKLTKAQFETYVLLGLPCITREDEKPFNILATMDI